MAGLLTAVETDRDEHLLSRHLSGDASAFGDLYALHYDRLLRHVRRRVRDWHLAEEIVQDTFVRAYEASAHLNDPRRFYPWLTVIANRLAIDAFRRAGRVSPVAALDAQMGLEPPADEGVIAACEAEAVEAAMARVRERHRQVLAWQNQGVSYEGIAQRLDAPLTTVPPLLFRARQAFKREYLAMVEADGLAAVPVLGAMVASFRRWRLRGSQFASHFPEPAVFTAQVAGAVMTAAAVLGPFGAGADGISSGIAFEATSSPAIGDASAGTALAGGDEAQNRLSGRGDDGDARPGDGQIVDRAMPYVRVNQAAHDRTREEARRQAPYFIEVGPAWFALDPEGDAERTAEIVDDSSGLP